MHEPLIVSVPLQERSYNILIGEDLLSEAGSFIRSALGHDGWAAAIVTNRTVFERYGHTVVKSLSAAGFRSVIHLMGDGERYKNLQTVERIYHFLAQNHLDRRCAIIALGGGVVGDVAGFVAASFLRGIPFVQVPTTLLAAIDSSIGGKTGVNLREGKNLVGAFHQPKLVIADVSLFSSLPPRELRAALYEALKYGVLADPQLFDLLSQVTSVNTPLTGDRLIEVVARCCQIKADVVASDEREAGRRQILNLGHTFGHALESITHYRRFKHGEAVGYGMILATQLASELHLIEEAEARQIEATVRSIGRLPSIADLDAEMWFEAMRHDKKARRQQLTFILPTRVGEVKIVSGVPDRLVKKTIRRLLRSPVR
ncbi:MAG: 3-dehydroquinate synthase [Acidobacteria bacterium]|nr:3-dehydroquinate synthase [Acidobacteriota bacterium]